MLDELGWTALSELDVELVAEQMAATTRVNIHCAFRSTLRTAAKAGLLKAMPALPPLPKVGRKVPRPMRLDDLEAILAAASPLARVVFELAAFTGLRPCEVRRLRWSDVDLKARTITVRRGVIAGEATTPKSYHHRVVPFGPRIRAALEAAAEKKRGPWAAVALTELGKPWGDYGLNQAFKRARKRAGLSGWTFRDLRHFYVTELFRDGASARAIQTGALFGATRTVAPGFRSDGERREDLRSIGGAAVERDPSVEGRAGDGDVPVGKSPGVDPELADR